jgi:hypothetical protein
MTPVLVDDEPGCLGRLVHPDHVHVARQRRKGFLLGPTDAADADAEALGRRLQ